MSGSPAEIFGCDVMFCPRCGSLLPVPDRSSKVTCLICKHSVSAKVFERAEEYTCLKFETYPKKKKEKEKKSDGPLVDRKCTSCGHDGMTYYTQQTRSADEGQTVFYNCPRCHAQEKEDS